MTGKEPKHVSCWDDLTLMNPSLVRSDCPSPYVYSFFDGWVSGPNYACDPMQRPLHSHCPRAQMHPWPGPQWWTWHAERRATHHQDSEERSDAWSGAWLESTLQIDLQHVTVATRRVSWSRHFTLCDDRCRETTIIPAIWGVECPCILVSLSSEL